MKRRISVVVLLSGLSVFGIGFSSNLVPTNCKSCGTWQACFEGWEHNQMGWSECDYVPGGDPPCEVGGTYGECSM